MDIDITTEESQTTVIMEDTTDSEMIPVCPPGSFGHECIYSCNCANKTEACHAQTGYCQSGCSNGASGPGCLVYSPSDNGDSDAVIALAILFVIVLVCLIALVLYIFIYKPKKQKKKEKYAQRAENAAYDFEEMETRATAVENGNYAIPRKSIPSDPTGELRRSVYRIKETDISVDAEPIGQGRYGDIMKGFLTRDNERVEVAYKTLDNGISDGDKTAFLSQLEMYSSITSHQNVLKFYGICVVGGQVFAAYEFAENGNLRNYLRCHGIPSVGSSFATHQNTITRQTLLQYAHDVAVGMRHLAKQKIIHRSLCARHVLLSSDFTVKIAGLNSPSLAGKPDSKRWLAPECLKKGEFTIETDIWSFGVLMWEIMSYGSQPYNEYKPESLKDLLESGYRLPKPDHCDSDIYGLMRWCWKDNADDRPTFLILSNTMREMIQSGQVRLDLTDDSDLDDGV